ncbi:hypothetical protein U0030_11020 [Brevundimonas bullata]|nr:hypothetical protein U0030_11020 [Brevundimonas bullata]
MDFIPFEGLGKFSREFRGSLTSRLTVGEPGVQKPPQFWLRGFL